MLKNLTLNANKTSLLTQWNRIKKLYKRSSPVSDLFLILLQRFPHVRPYFCEAGSENFLSHRASKSIHALLVCMSENADISHLDSCCVIIAQQTEVQWNPRHCKANVDWIKRRKSFSLNKCGVPLLQVQIKLQGSQLTLAAQRELFYRLVRRFNSTESSWTTD